MIPDETYDIEKFILSYERKQAQMSLPGNDEPDEFLCVFSGFSRLIVKEHSADINV